jgi:histidine phosphotransferase ChpT
MVAALDMRILALLTARLCHELIGPVTAIGAGIEVLSDESGDFAREAAALVGESGRRLAARLEFYRFAYGFGGDTPTGSPPHELAARFFAEAAIDCDYSDAVRGSSLARQKLACNLLLVGAEALPRGGRLVLGVAAAGPVLDVLGEGAGLGSKAALALETPPAALTTRSVQPYFAGLLARDLGLRLVVDAAEAGRIRLAAAAL